MLSPAKNGGTYCYIAGVKLLLLFTYMKTPITYYGGKQTMLKYIIPVLPEHRIYTESFFGGGAVLFAKPQSHIEVVNDLNGEMINFYTVLKTKYNELKYEVDTTLHSREQHTKAQIVYTYPDMFTDVKRAWAIWTLASQSFSSSLTGGWGYDNSTNSTSKRLNNKRLAFDVDISKRLETVQIERNDALKVILSRDAIDTFHYIDPPYYNACMGHYGGYQERDFDDLLYLLGTIKGKFLLSSYPSELLKKYTKQNGWQTFNVEKKVAVTGKTSKMKTEVLTANYDICSTLSLIK